MQYNWRKKMKLGDRIYGETDDACAICGFRGAHGLTIHHIDGDSSNNVYENMIVLCQNCHQAYHSKKVLKKDIIIERKKHLIRKTITIYGENALKIANRNGFGVIAPPFLLYHLVDLGYMTKEEDQMGYGPINDATSRFAITKKGNNIVKKWLNKK